MPRRPYLVVGPSGTGKTSLALQFLCEGVRRGEPALYVTLEDPPNEIRRNHKALGPELDKIDVFDAIPDVMRYERIPFKDISSVRDVVPFSDVTEDIRQTPEFTSTEVTIAALEQFLRMQTYRRGYARMVIDSLTALQYFCMKGFDSMLGAQTFLRFLSDLRTTTVLTVESPVEGADTPERMLARGEIRMFRWEREGVTVRAVGVEKFRGSAHDSRLHPYRIGPKGVEVNLSVTVTRDTREIAEPAFRGLVPALDRDQAAAADAIPATVSSEIKDLLDLGVDVSPLRPAAEAAMAEVQAGHLEGALDQLFRLSQLTRSLTSAALIAHAAISGRTANDSEILRRASARAERARAGAGPVARQAPPDLRMELELVMGLLPPPVGGLEERVGRAETGLSEPEVVESPSTTSLLIAVPEEGPAPTHPPGARDLLDLARAARSPPSELLPPDPSAGAQSASDTEPDGAAAVSTDLSPLEPTPVAEAEEHPRPRTGRPGHAPGIAEPPPLPGPSISTPVLPPASSPVEARPLSLEEATPAASAPATPRLPEPLPQPGEGDVVVAPTAKPAVRRRRKPTTTKAATPALTLLPPEEGEAGVPAKPKRRVVRRKKAPPVVSATAEPLPPAPEEASATSAPADSSPSTEAPLPPVKAPAESDPPGSTPPGEP